VALYSVYTHDVVRISGPDAHKLLNDTLTCRFDEGLVGAGRWFALLSPQGKIQVDGLVTFARDAYWFDIEAGLVAEFVKRMKMYRLRAKVEIESLNADAVWWTPDGDARAEGKDVIAYRDERAPTLGTRFVNINYGSFQGMDAGHFMEPYNALRVAAGVPEFGPDYGRDSVFPHDVAMDFLGGIDFKKGCYIGQEVVSRMEHRGTARRRPVIVSGLDATGIDVPILVGDRAAGTVGVSEGGTAVAIVRLDRFDGGEVTVGGKPVTVTLPDWATYRLGESAPAD
jgi:folate-binding protein YgfZ